MEITVHRRHKLRQCTCIPVQKRVCFLLLLFKFICWIQLCDKKNLTFVDCRDQILPNDKFLDMTKLKAFADDK